MDENCGALDAFGDAGLEVCIDEAEHNLLLLCSTSASGDEFSYSHMGASSPGDRHIDPMAQQSSDSQGGEANPLPPTVTETGKVEPGVPQDGATVAKHMLAKQLMTVMIRNVHNRICADDFALKLDELGFEGQYDLCLIPTDPMSGRGKGFGFVNFLTPHAAARFCPIAETISFPNASAKHLQVAVARLQGAELTLQPRTRKSKKGKRAARTVFFPGHSTKAQNARADADTDPVMAPESSDSQGGKTNLLPLSVAETGKVTPNAAPCVRAEDLQPFATMVSAPQNGRKSLSAKASEPQKGGTCLSEQFLAILMETERIERAAGLPAPPPQTAPHAAWTPPRSVPWVLPAFESTPVASAFPSTPSPDWDDESCPVAPVGYMLQPPLSRRLHF
jgi:hypothetical protein